MIRISNIKIAVQKEQKKVLEQEICRLLRLKSLQQLEYHIVKKSVDARKKESIFCIYTVDVAGIKEEAKLVAKCRKDNIAIAKQEQYAEPVHGDAVLSGRPVVIGAGPAGLFAALLLAEHGYQPLLLERGQDVDTRTADVERFWQTGVLNVQSNVQFGEGGAGTFSDGKLNTGVNNVRIGWILEQFVKAGAREDILYDAKPHVGTDVLLTVVQNIRQRIISLGGEVRFNTQVTGLCMENGELTGLKTETGEIIPCDTCVLAIGHSARDTFEMLEATGIPMEPKPFAMGVRIEHKQTTVDESQYGMVSPVLPPADYKLVEHLEDATVYTFCMCPGGYVVAAASEEGGVVTNGMSFSDRAGENANSAVLVTVQPRDFPYPGALGGVMWQREIEEKAYAIAGGYRAPAQRFGDFLEGKPSDGQGAVRPTYLPGVHWCDLHEVLPQRITDNLKKGILDLDNRMKGFADPDAVLTGPETRSSSPVRIVRDENGQTSLRGLYPAGEGAGYAGGIMSAAVDGMEAAEAVLKAMVK